MKKKYVKTAGSRPFSLNAKRTRGDVYKRQVVLILSPQWFTKEGILPPAYASRFSDETFVAMLQNKKISRGTKDYIIKRTKKLLSGDPQTKERDVYKRQK